ncbi:MAG: hypothetical protein C0594_03960, partial [Marinilabiliales bacterium]
SNSSACEWKSVYAIWNSGSNTTADLCIINLSGNSSDFALDDIMFGTYCQSTDDIVVQVTDAPYISLGNDREMCEGENFTLNPGSGYASYLWQDGSTSTTYNVTESGIYNVTVTSNEGCTSTDSMNTNVIPFPHPEIGEDQTICEGDSIVLDAGPGYIYYSWSNGEATQVVTLTQDGEYSVLVLNECGMNSDTMYLHVIQSPDLQLPDSVLLCGNEIYSLEAGASADSYLWNTGESSSSI